MYGFLLIKTRLITHQENRKIPHPTPGVPDPLLTLQEFKTGPTAFNPILDMDSRGRQFVLEFFSA